MHLTTQSNTQLHSIFGSGYVPEQHVEATQHHLPPTEQGISNLEDAIRAIRNAMFDEILQALRGALSLR